MTRKQPPSMSGPTQQARPQRGRREPALGRLDEIDVEARAPRLRLPRRPARWSDRHWGWWVGSAVIGALLIVTLFRQPIADRFWPETRAQALQAEAAEALARNHLTATDGSGARELYEAALAIDPDRSQASTGLSRVAAAALVQSVAALSRNDFGAAHQYLDLARDLSVPQAHAETVAHVLRQREGKHAGLDLLLASADSARRGGRLHGDTQTALPLYQRVLELEPERAEALRGREDALTELLEMARAHLRHGELAQAARQIDIARKYDPGHMDLPDSEARLTEETDALRRRADRHLQRGQLARATGDYRRLLALSADDEAAVRGLSAVAVGHAARAERLAADFKFAEAEAELKAAQTLAPEAAEVRDAGRHVAVSRRSSERLVPTVSAPGRDRRVDRLLAEAAAAEARGDLLTPPGDSAYDKLRAARALAPNAAAVRQASDRLLPAAAGCFERELRGNNLARARACLDALGTLSDDAARIRKARQRLAQRWLAVGDERLGAGELQAAAAAVAQAQALDRSAPGLSEFDQRVRTATASED